MQSPKMMTRLCTLLGGGRSWAEYCGRLRGQNHRNDYIIRKQQPCHICSQAGNAPSIGPGVRAASVRQDRAGWSSRAFTSTTAAAAAYPAAAAASQQLWRIWMSLPAGLAVAATALYSSQDGMVTLPESEQQCSETMAAVARSVQATGEAIEVPTAGHMARSSRIGQLAVGKDDHIFVGLQQQELIKEYRCFFDKTGSRFHTVVHLGDNACGYPKTIHGGLTAAVLDECFGGLMLNLWRTGGLGLRAPMFTAKLEVNYKKKLPAGALVLCTATFSRLEGRKLWMDAQITDCRGQVVYATGRALFVSPRWSRMITDIARSWLPFQRGADAGISRART